MVKHNKLLRTAINSSDIPHNWAYCFNDNCPRHEVCLHHISTIALDDSHTAGKAIFANALRPNDSCQHYKPMRIINTAWGFDRMFDEVKTKDAPILRAMMRNYLGGNSMYYRYHHGIRRLSPEQQNWIKQLFERYGYKNICFNYTREEIDFM